MKNPISHHIFLFPFRWDLKAGRSFLEKTDLSTGFRNVEKLGTPSGEFWQPFQFEIKAGEHKLYNEWSYFHPFLNDVLFGSQKETSVVRQFGIRPPQNEKWHYVIEVGLTDKPREKYPLQIEELTLNFYETGIGFLAFHLNNFEASEPQEILRINDFGRRIYPQFLPLNIAKNAFLADQISIFKGETQLTDETFKKFINLETGLERMPFPDHVHKFLPDKLGMDYDRLIDDRMFVICWVGSKRWSEDLKANGFLNKKESSDWWYQLVFVDGKYPGLSNEKMQLDLVRQSTYDRWSGERTYFGISRNSFVCLTDGDGFATGVVLPHMQSIYFQITMLCLLQRGSVLRFSEEIANEKGVNLEDLYDKYRRFINKIHFREVTAQDQGIELYELLQEKMNIGREVERLENEIKEHYAQDNLKSEKRQADAIDSLTMLGSVLLVPALILAFYGITDFPDSVEKFCFTKITAFVVLASMLIAGLTVSDWMRQKARPGPNALRKWLAPFLGGLLILILVSMPFWFGCFWTAAPPNNVETSLQNLVKSVEKIQVRLDSMAIKPISQPSKKKKQ